MKRTIRWLLLLVGIACTVVFFSFTSHSTRTAEGESAGWRIGFEPSPWFRYEKEPSEKFVAGVQVESWSWLFAAVACASFWGSWRLKASAPPQLPPTANAGS
jgi:hypothetical protein